MSDLKGTHQEIARVEHALRHMRALERERREMPILALRWSGVVVVLNVVLWGGAALMGTSSHIGGVLFVSATLAFLPSALVWVVTLFVCVGYVFGRRTDWTVQQGRRLERELQDVVERTSAVRGLTLVEERETMEGALSQPGVRGALESKRESRE